MLCKLSTLLLLLPTLAFASKSGSHHANSDCTGTISSLDDVPGALQCRTININGFKIPGGKTLILKTKLDNVVMNLLGDLEFGVEFWEGRLMVVGGSNIQFNGGGYKLLANGEKYWDGKGLTSLIKKPAPTLQILATGVVQDLVILNTPAQAVSIQNNGDLLVKNILIDDSAGNAGGRGHNTDGFGVSHSNGLTIYNCTVMNQDDCIALNSATNTHIKNVKCINGHGVSIGSIESGQSVTHVLVENTVIEHPEQCFRIKTYANARGALVKNITYTGNTCSDAQKFGVLINQNYQNGGHVDTKEGLSTVPSSEVRIDGINFIGAANVITVAANAWRAGGACAPGMCKDWNFNSLQISGGLPGHLINTPVDSFVSDPPAKTPVTPPALKAATPKGGSGPIPSETPDPSGSSPKLAVPLSTTPPKKTKLKKHHHHDCQTSHRKAAKFTRLTKRLS